MDIAFLDEQGLVDLPDIVNNFNEIPTTPTEIPLEIILKTVIGEEEETKREHENQEQRDNDVVKKVSIIQAQPYLIDPQH